MKKNTKQDETPDVTTTEADATEATEKITDSAAPPEAVPAPGLITPLMASAAFDPRTNEDE